MDNPFEITLYDKAFARKGVIGAPDSATFELELNALSTGTVAVRPNDPMRQFLDAKGARFRCVYRGEHLMSGYVDNSVGRLTPTGSVEYNLVDDWSVLSDTLAWVVPFATARSSGQLVPQDSEDDAQSWTDSAHDPFLAEGYEYFLWPDGSANWGGLSVTSTEMAIKTVIEVNAITRLGRPLTILPDLGRGGDPVAAEMLPDLRFDPLDDGLADLIEWSDLVVKLWHDGATAAIQMDVAEPTSWPAELTLESGIITDGHWNLNGPYATRVVVGGPGEGNARAFWGVNDTTLDLEATYNRIVEVFRDAAGFNLLWPDLVVDENRVPKYFLLQGDPGQVGRFVKYLDFSGTRALKEGRPTSGLSLTLSETDQFHFHGPDGIHLGDEVKVRLNGVRFQERIRGASLTFNSNGLTVAPRVGDRIESPSAVLAGAIARLSAAQRRLSTSK